MKRKFLNSGSVILCGLLFVALVPLRLSAQIDTARLTGVVTDSTGAVIPSVAITVTNDETGVVQKTQSNSVGTYVIEALPPGTYTVRAECEGFQKHNERGVVLHIQDKLTLNISLVPGTVQETIVVTSAAPLIQQGDASVGQTISSNTVNSLPLVGRNWASLSQLTAGVTTPAGASPTMATFTVNGLNFGQNDYRLNGIDDNAEVFGGTIFGTNASVTPPPDAIQEFKIQTGNYDAQFGHSQGGVVNAVVKSGTNTLHGSMWDYLRNTVFDANDYISKRNNQPVPAFRQNQFGGTIGGPVYIPGLYNGKNKTFFFFDYQATRTAQGQSITATVPTPLMVSSGFTNLQDLITYNVGTAPTDALGRVFPAGTILDPATTRFVANNTVDSITGLPNNSGGDAYVRDPFYTGGSIAGMTDFTGATQYLNQLPRERLDPNAVKLLGVYPAANQPGFQNNYYNGALERDRVDQLDIRVDHNFGGKDTLFVVFDRDHIQNHKPTILPGIADGGAWGTGLIVGDHYALTGAYSHVFSPTLVNDFHFGYLNSTENLTSDQSNIMGIPAQYGIQGIPQVPGNGGLPNIGIAGPLTGLGYGGWWPTLQPVWNYELSDNLTKVRGKHILKTGYQLFSIQGNITQPPWSRGTFFYSGQFTDVPDQATQLTGLADLLLTPITSSVAGGIDNLGGVTQFQGSNFSPIRDHRYYMAAYLQDDYKVNSRLTLNLGLRWDYFRLPVEIAGHQANFVQDGGDGDTGTYYIPKSGCQAPRSPEFDTLLEVSGIRLVCTSDNALGHAPKTNFAPRVGLAYGITPKLVMRAGFGISYGALGSIGGGPNIGFNYPFQYTFSFSAPTSQQPLQLPDGSTATMEEAFAGYNIQDPTLVSPYGLQLQGRQLNFKTPYVESYNLSFQYGLSHFDSVQVAYVGNAGRHLDNIGYHNSPSVIVPPDMSGYTGVPFPNFAPASNYLSTDGISSYNSLQVTYEHRSHFGLETQANYTFSKCLTDQRINTGDYLTAPYFRAEWLPGFGITKDYSLCVTDSRNVVHASGSYELPFGRKKKWLNSARVLNRFVGGWSVNFIFTYQAGEPFTVPCPISTTAAFGCYALVVPGQNMYDGPHNARQWLNPNAFANPPLATEVGQTDYSPLGQAPNQAIGPGFKNLDFSLFKQFDLTEKTHLEFRAEAFNLTNTPQFEPPQGDLDFMHAPNFSQLNALSNGPRILQFALKLSF